MEGLKPGADRVASRLVDPSDSDAVPVGVRDASESLDRCGRLTERHGLLLWKTLATVRMCIEYRETTKRFAGRGQIDQNHPTSIGSVSQRPPY